MANTNIKGHNRYIQDAGAGFNPFHEWTEQSAYAYGYILGDGCVYKRGNSHCMYIASKDLQIMQVLLEVFQRSPDRIKPVKIKGESVAHRFHLHDKGVYESLISLGLTSTKSKDGCYIERPPDNLLHHFIRGLFDSDGTAAYTNNKTGLRVGLYGHPSYINQIKDWLPFEFRESIQGRLKVLYLQKRESVQSFFEFLYKDSTISLERKRVKVGEFYPEVIYGKY